jgi:uncharacterized protein YaiI (UPF0178 family)
LLHIYVDADGCPVKREIYRVATRYELKVTLVANAWMRTPNDDLVAMVVVDGQFDSADDWIVEHASEGDIVITADIPLAARCLKKGARVLGPKGHVFKEDSIGEALAHREILSHLRDTGTITRGPAPFAPKDRSRFLQRLDEIVHAVRRGK